MFKKVCAALALMGLTAAVSNAQSMGGSDSTRSGQIGVSIKLLLPMDDLKDRWKTGLGAGLSAEAPVAPMFSIIGEVSFNRFPGKAGSILGVDFNAPDLDAWQISGGAKAYLGHSPLYVGVQGGYWFFSLTDKDGSDNDVDDNRVKDEGGVLPLVGIRSGWLDLSVQYKLGGNTKWVGVKGTFSLGY